METSRKSTHQMCLTMTSSSEDRHVRITVLPENEPDYAERKAACSMNLSGLYEKNNLAIYSSKMLRESLAATRDGISPEFSLNWKTLGTNVSGKYVTQRRIFHRTESASSLSDILQDPSEVDPKYFLSEKALNRFVKNNNIICHSTLPRSSKNCNGGTGHLQKNDGTTYCIDAANNIAIEIPQMAGCLTGGGHSGGNHSDMTILNNGGGIRRLTPIEGERLMGFPDNFTAGVADTNRYRCIGNSVTVPVVADIMKEILKRIAE